MDTLLAVCKRTGADSEQANQARLLKLIGQLLHSRERNDDNGNVPRHAHALDCGRLVFVVLWWLVVCSDGTLVSRNVYAAMTTTT